MGPTMDRRGRPRKARNVEGAEKLSVAIVGGGPGCKAIMDMIFAERLSELRMKLIGVASTNTKAVGYLYGKEKGLYTTTDYRTLYELKDLNMIIELTGRDEVANEISRTKPEHIRLMDHVAARLFWDVFQIEEDRIALRSQAEAALRAAEQEKDAILGSLVEHVVHQDTTLKVLWANRAACASAGLSLEEIIGRHCYEIWANRKEVCPNCPVAKAVETGQTREVERWNRDGRAWYIRGDPMRDDKGNIIGAVEVTLDITERKQAERELRKSRQQLRDLSAHLQAAREQERAIVAREIHDDLGQTLTALKMDLSWLEKKLPREQNELIQKTKTITKAIDTAVQSVRRIYSGLRPFLLDDLGLLSAMEWMARGFQNNTGIKCELNFSQEDMVLNKDLTTTIFRIFQEALTNVGRHANATRVEVGLEEKAKHLKLTISDDGRGITEEEISHPRSFGLMGIRERALAYDGKVEIRGVPNKGTTVSVSIPRKK